MFPVSAVMLKAFGDYQFSLESFSKPLLKHIDYRLNATGEMTVNNYTAHLYQYMDLTIQAESLYGFVKKTVYDELVAELDFLVSYDRAKTELQGIIDMPDPLIDLFIKLCIQNNGSLSSRKRASHFSFLTDDELIAMEQVVPYK